MKRWRLYGMLLLVVPPMGCINGPPKDGPIEPGGPPVQVAITSTTLDPVAYVQVGDTLRLAALPLDAAGFEVGTAAELVRTWKVSASTLARLDPQGPSGREVLVTGVMPGVVKITATMLGVSGTRDLTVLPKLQSVVLAPASTQLAVGDSTFIAATITDAAGHEITGLFPEWRFGDARIAAFRDIGVPAGLELYALAPGTYDLGIGIAHFTGAPATIEVVEAAGQ